ncbi:hypothetical protein FGO68_gene2289 [Halteria grandinella]|uniref:Uncharacterized protein n=1 Tax=Halteria grandinella TaxID=5974 RepID=A0A8J8SY01_HALGN|nr:hypothetical protein FGO68_gene2289 [Halteria grandinella]
MSDNGTKKNNSNIHTYFITLLKFMKINPTYMHLQQNNIILIFITSKNQSALTIIKNLNIQKACYLFQISKKRNQTHYAVKCTKFQPYFNMAYQSHRIIFNGISFLCKQQLFYYNQKKIIYITMI